MKRARHQLCGRFVGVNCATLRSADGGLLFLDEQAMLLKAIEEKRFFPFGSDKEVESDFQLISGTVRNLHQWVMDGKFCEDLYARINLWIYDLPGLADRAEDIEPNLLDLFDRLQLENLIKVCQQSSSLSDAGRRLFGVSRQEKAKANDADRLRKYLGRFGLEWRGVKEGGE